MTDREWLLARGGGSWDGLPTSLGASGTTPERFQACSALGNPHAVMRHPKGVDKANRVTGCAMFFASPGYCALRVTVQGVMAW